MRSREFLLEYRRDITANNFGDALFKTLDKTPNHGVPDELYSFGIISDMALRFTNYEHDIKKGRRLNSFGKWYTITNAESAMAALQELKPKAIDAILSIIEEADPTPNKMYTQWLIRMWINGNGDTLLEDLNRNQILTAYHRAKSKNLIKPEDKDINKFKNYRDFEKTIRSKYDINVLLGLEASAFEKGNYKVLLDNDDVSVVQLLDLKASEYWGEKYNPNKERRAEWCTLQPDNFYHYTNQGPLYVIKPKKERFPGEKYQFHFPSGQFMDINDDPANFYYMVTERYPELKDLFIKLEPGLTNTIMFADDNLVIGIWKAIMEIAYDQAITEVDYWAEHDPSFDKWRTEQAIKGNFQNKDGEIYWDTAYDKLNLEYTDYNESAKTFLQDIKDISNASIEYIKRITLEYVDTINTEMNDVGNFFIQTNVGHLTNIAASVVRQEAITVAVTEELADYLDHNVIITKGRPPLPSSWGNKKIIKVGSWNVVGSTDSEN